MKKIIQIIKENISFILILILITFLFYYKLPYYIEAPGGLININNRYKIENEYKTNGSFNMTYVSEYKANIPMYLYALVNKDLDIYKNEEIIPSNETEQNSNDRGEILLKEANDNAIIIAYNKANKKCDITKSKLIITYIEDDSNTNLNVGDEIIRIDNKNINNKEEAINIIKTHNIGDKITLKIKRNNKIYNKYAYLKKDKIIGILISYDREIVTNPKIDIKYKDNEYGSSGGLMATLTIYNKLTSNDITNGKVIAGTGTIEEDGTVGEIDGIKYKLKGAVKNKADVFLVPSGDNYKEAIKLKKKNNYKIKIVEVKNIDDAIKYLEKGE